jgi:hypothetical protein
VKYIVSILIVLLAVVFVSGCTTQSTTSLNNFSSDGISFQYPGNWSVKPIPANDLNLTSQSGFKMLGVLLDGNELKDYTAYVGIGKGNLTQGNLTEAANRLYKYYISAESGDYLTKTNITLKNGYKGFKYVYGGTGASSNKSLDSVTYIFTKDNQTVYYIQFAVPRGLLDQNSNNFQRLIDSVTIN